MRYPSQGESDLAVAAGVELGPHCSIEVATEQRCQVSCGGVLEEQALCMFGAGGINRYFQSLFDNFMENLANLIEQLAMKEAGRIAFLPNEPLININLHMYIYRQLTLIECLK